MREFDRKFGRDFLAGVPAAPGVYRFHGEGGALLYVGMTANLRRRLGQYRMARRRKRDRKRRALVRRVAAITWEVCDSALSAALLEIRLIQSLRPPMNVATAFPFLYPYIGISTEGRETYFCLTTRPEAFPAFAFHGVFRSRAVTREAFFSLMRLLRFAGHPVPRHRCRRLGTAPRSSVIGFRRLPSGAAESWGRLLSGSSREALETLTLRLLDHAGALARRAEVHEDLRAVARFFRDEACALARARIETGYTGYPVPQAERDLLFARYRAIDA